MLDEGSGLGGLDVLRHGLQLAITLSAALRVAQ
jgi:hypothetical protein